MTQSPSFYEIDLKQGDLLIQLISDDAGFISTQMARWLTLLSDDKVTPVAIRPGLPSLGVVPQVSPPPVAVSPAVSTPVAEPSETRMLLAQIQALQSQVQSLTQQVAHPPQPLPAPIAEAPPPPSIPVATVPEAIPVPLPAPLVMPEAPQPLPPSPVPQTTVAAPISAPEAAPVVPLPEPVSFSPAPVLTDNADLDALVSPAHQEISPNFGTLGQVESPNMGPVNNLAQPVDNLQIAASAPPLQTPSPVALMDIPTPAATPVENPNAPAAAPDEFDALLSSILTDVTPAVTPLEQALPVAPLPAPGMVTPVAMSPVPEQQQMLEAPPVVATSVEPLLPEAVPTALDTPAEITPTQPEESPFEAALEDALSGLTPNAPSAEPASVTGSGMAGALFDEPGHDAFESALESALAEPASSPALSLEALATAPQPTPAVSSGVAGALFDEPGNNAFESALESALAEPAHAAPALDLAALSKPQPQPEPAPLSGVAGALFDAPEAPNLEDLGLPPIADGPVYTPPQVNYDFGIPLPDVPVDPGVRQLNLDSLQISPPEGAPFDSPFPQVEEEGEGPAPVHEAFALEPEAALETLQVETFQDLCDLAPQAASGPDFLILSAFFLSRIQHADKYALKDLNAHLMRAGLTPVNHSVLEQVMAQGLLQLVPDLTGTASTAEYRLTDQGEIRANELLHH